MENVLHKRIKLDNFQETENNVMLSFDQILNSIIDTIDLLLRIKSLPWPKCYGSGSGNANLNFQH